MAIRYFIVLLGLCFSNLALAATVPVSIYKSVYNQATNTSTDTILQLTFYVDSDEAKPCKEYLFAASGGSSGQTSTSGVNVCHNTKYLEPNEYGIYTAVTTWTVRKGSYIYDCVPSPDTTQCLPIDEGCQDTGEYKVNSSSSTACITMPSGAQCQSGCTSGICVDSGSGVNHTLSGASCTPSDYENHSCEYDELTGSCVVQAGSGGDGSGDVDGGDSGDGNNGSDDFVDVGSGSGGGSFQTGGGVTSGGAVDSPSDSSGTSRDYTAALNRIISNQDAINNSALSIINNQIHSHNALLAIRGSSQSTSDYTKESRDLLAQILMIISGDVGGSPDGGTDGGGSGSDGSGSGGDSGSASGAGSTYELLANADVPELPGQSSVLPEQVVDFSNFEQYIKTDYFGGGSGSCPPDYSITIPGFSDFTITYQPFCDFAVLVRPVIILLAWVAFILSLRNLRA